MLRIIAGELKGRRLQSPPGKDTRPSGARLREALFSILEAMGMVREARVLDVCAGSGALGMEAISRGAALCVFVENDPKAIPALSANLRLAGSRASLIASDFRLFKQGEFDLVLADPPYNTGLATSVLPWLAESDLLLPAGLAVIEHSLQEEPIAPAMFTMLDQRRYGQSKISFFEKN